MKAKTIYEYWLAAIPDLPGHIKIKIEEFYPKLQQFYAVARTRLTLPLWLTEPQRQMILRARPIEKIKHEYEQMEMEGVRMIHWSDPDYPQRLLTLHDMPYAVFLKGRLPDITKKAVAIVGARVCSPYGKRLTKLLATELTRAGFAIISGMASGVDGHAQQATLNGGGYSLGILGCGVCVCYPEHHRALYESLIDSGGILSEYPIYEQPIKHHFPQRNRLISCLSEAVIVIEAREKSGSLITADFALEQGREVYALPGPLDSPLSAGCHRLIEQGAHIITSPLDLIRSLRRIPMQASSTMTKPIREQTSSESRHDKVSLNAVSLHNDPPPLYDDIPTDLMDHEQEIWRQLSDTPMRLSQLEEATGFDPVLLARTLMGLQLRGYVQEVSRQSYIRLF